MEDMEAVETNRTEMSRFMHFLDNSQPYAPAVLYTQEYFWYSILLEAE